MCLPAPAWHSHEGRSGSRTCWTGSWWCIFSTIVLSRLANASSAVCCYSRLSRCARRCRASRWQEGMPFWSHMSGHLERNLQVRARAWGSSSSLGSCSGRRRHSIARHDAEQPCRGSCTFSATSVSAANACCSPAVANPSLIAARWDAGSGRRLRQVCSWLLSHGQMQVHAQVWPIAVQLQA